ncbi:hypothetical protein ABZX85_35755 [Streptomyces sp. NPDC004539]|uniref:hypothetical protein n=1 Tax=Streptomyces sp. NPDC004539 TaxID=3154280 RepID=UPI0033BC94DB
MTASSFPELPETPDYMASLWAHLAEGKLDYFDMGVASPEFQDDLVWATDTMPILVQVKHSRIRDAWRARNVLESWSSKLKGLNDRASDLPEELTLLLLRTVEEASGFPSITSGLIHGIELTTPPVQLWRSYEEHVEAVYGLVNAAMGGSKTLGRLITQFQLAGQAIWAERIKATSFLGRLVNDVETARKFLQDLAQGLCDGVQHIEYLVAVPPHESSPCGVLRLASPIVPGAPGTQSWPHQTSMTLAA